MAQKLSSFLLSRTAYALDGCSCGVAVGTDEDGDDQQLVEVKKMQKELTQCFSPFFPLAPGQNRKTTARGFLFLTLGYSRQLSSHGRYSRGKVEWWCEAEIKWSV